MKSAFTSRLMEWNRTSNDRKMPWKGEKDPYKIWLSEIILQQTRVEQGWKYYEKFINEFPTIQHLAESADEKIFKAWEGLGYYTRCKNLIETARKVSGELRGIFPPDYDGIKQLKGIGPYTAAAISSFAYNERRAVVDGNVQRVIARYFGITTPVDTTVGKNVYQELANELLNRRNPGLYNQAMMDFGATVCKPHNPICESCVQKKDCVAFTRGYVHRLPVKEKSLQKKNRWFHYFLIEIDAKVLIRKRIEKDIWQNLHEFVLLETKEAFNRPFRAHPFLETILLSQPYEITEVSKMYKQQLTHQNIHGQFIRLKTKNIPSNLSSFALIEKNQLHQYAFPKLITNYLEEIRSSD